VIADRLKRRHSDAARGMAHGNVSHTAIFADQARDGSLAFRL
jgi:hypothetical protein